MNPLRSLAASTTPAHSLRWRGGRAEPWPGATVAENPVGVIGKPETATPEDGRHRAGRRGIVATEGFLMAARGSEPTSHFVVRPRRSREVTLVDPSRNGNPADSTAVKLTVPKPANTARYRATDVGNGHRLAEWGKYCLRRCPNVGWFVWDGMRWLRDVEDIFVHQLAKATANGIRREIAYAQSLAADASDSGERMKWDGIAKAFEKHARVSESAARIAAMIKMASSEPELVIDGGENAANALDAHPYLLNLRNGVLDLKSIELRPHDPALLLTKLANSSFLAAADAPFWNAFLRMILPDPDVRRYVQKAAGYSVLGTYSEYLFIPWGAGKNGKSTFLRALRDVLGDYAAEAPAELLVHRREWGPSQDSALAGLRGSRLVTTIETEEGKRMAEALTKQLTGEADIKAKFMRQDFFTYRNQAAVWLATNHKPIIQGRDFAIWRRLRLIPFEVTIKKTLEPERVAQRLRQERDGILAWMIEGLRLYWKEGMEPPEVVREATEEYRKQMDPVGEWLDSCCELDPAAATPIEQVRTSYEFHCDQSGRQPLGGIRFNEVLEELGCRRDSKWLDSRTRKVWTGLRVAPLR